MRSRLGAVLGLLGLLACQRAGETPGQGRGSALEAAGGRPAGPGVVPGSARDARGRGLDLLLVTVDTLRCDHMSLYGYARPTTPEIDRFFAAAEVYERAYSAEANTTPSIVTLLTGLYPFHHRVRLFYQRIEPGVMTLADYLRRAGYQTAAVVSNMVLTDEATGLASRFDAYDDFVDQRELNRNIFERPAARTTGAALRWLLEGCDRSRPHFLWVHYIDPHGPYTPPAGGPRHFSHPRPQPVDLANVPDYQRLPGVEDGLEYVDRYDEEIAYADREVGRLLRVYGSLGLVDRAVVVFAADHGEIMMEHEPNFDHGLAVWDPVMRVPLALRRPGASSRRVDTPVSLADVTPTLLDLLGLPAAEGLDGRRLSDRRVDDVISLEASEAPVEQRALLRGGAKWWVAVDSRGRIADRWCGDLARDPAELGRGPWREGPEAAELEGWVGHDPDPGGRPRRYARGIHLSAPKVAPGLDPAQLERLRSLGYVR